MSLTLSANVLNIIGIVFSAIGITLALFEAFVRKVHSRALDYLQWAYILALATSVSFPFSMELEVASSIIALNDEAMSTFYTPKGTYVGVTAFGISFLAILVGFLILIRLITIPEKVTEKGLTFRRVYRFLKGLIKWFYLPLGYLAILALLSGGSLSIPAIVVLAVFVAYPIIQLILYKFFDQEGEDPIVKWLQFTNYLKAILFAVLTVLGSLYQTSVYSYYIAFIIVLNAGFFVFKNNFRYEIAGKVFYLSGEVIFYFLYSLYASGSLWISTYYLDLFGLGVILLLDVIYLIMESVSAYKEWKNTGGEVIPEDTKDGPITKKNRYEVEDLEGELNKNNSRDTLNDSNAMGNSSINKTKNTRARPSK